MSPLLTRRERLIYMAMAPITRSNVVARAREIRARARWSAEQMEAFRLDRLRRLLAEAAGTVPYYQRLFREHRFDPRDVRAMSDIAAVPPLTRELLTSRFDELRSTTARDEDVMRRSSGGTTGNPVTVLLDRATALESTLINHRMMALMGRTLGTPTLMIAGSPIDSVAWTSFRDSMKNRLFNVTIRSSFGLTPRMLNDIERMIRGGRYAFVVAYASVFDILAARGRLPIRNIVPAAELVTAAQRASWRDAFGCNVFEIYGSREMTSIAGELPDHEGLAINTDLFHVEATDDDGRPVPNGTPGILTITALNERRMPLIRYQLGDAGVIHDAPHGSPYPFPRLTITHGRVLDVIRCPDGKLLPGEFFPHLMKEVQDAVARFQVVQTRIDSLVIRIVPSSHWSGDTETYLRTRIEDQVGREMAISFEIVSEIETSASGKYRPTISLVPRDQKRFGS